MSLHVPSGLTTLSPEMVMIGAFGVDVTVITTFSVSDSCGNPLSVTINRIVSLPVNIEGMTHVNLLSLSKEPSGLPFTVVVSICVVSESVFVIESTHVSPGLNTVLPEILTDGL